MSQPAASILSLAAPGRWLRALTGPIFDKELRVSSRRLPTYLLRTGYMVLLASFVAVTWAVVTGGSGAPMDRAYRMARAGQTITAVLLGFQFVGLQLVAVVMLSGAIGEEVTRRTLGVLMTTPISAVQIVVGKLASRMLQVLLLLAVSVPVLVVVRVFGGVPMEFVTAGVCITLTATLFAGAVSLLFSTRDRHAWRVILKTLGTLGILHLLLPGLMLALIMNIRGQPSNSIAPFEVILVAVNPWAAGMVALNKLFYPGGMPSALFAYWPVHCAFMLGLTFLVLAACVRRVRRVGLEAAAGGAEPAAGPACRAAPMRVRRVSGSPVAWRELRSRSFSRPWKTVLATVGVVGLLVLSYLVAENSLGSREVHFVYVIVLAGFAAVVTAALAASRLPAEKEAGTWPILLVTPMTGRAIVAGKAVGAAWRSLPWWGLVMLHMVFFLPNGPIEPMQMALVAAACAGVAAFILGLGMLAGMLLRKTTTAVVVTVLVLLALWGAVPLALVIIGENEFGRAVPGLRSLCGYGISADPFVQMGVVMLSRVSDGAQRCYWPQPLGGIGAATTAVLVMLTAFGHAALGVGMAAVAAAFARRKAV